MTPEQEIKLLKELLYCTKRSCNNCGKVNCENFQRQRIDCCGLWVSYKDYIKQQEEQIESQKKEITQAHIDGYNRGYAKAKEKTADIKANCDLAIEGRDVKIADLEKQLEQVKVLLNAEREVNEKKEYLQYTEYLMAQLEVAKDLIHQFLIQNPISDWLPKKAEQFLKEGEECRLQKQLMKNTKN